MPILPVIAAGAHALKAARALYPPPVIYCQCQQACGDMDEDRDNPLAVCKGLDPAREDARATTE